MFHSKSKPNRKHAIVIGSGMAGLLAARVLTNHFDQVTIVERDRFLEKPAPRSGVPQSHQLHLLLAQGLQILEQLFPGLSDELTLYGVPKIDCIADFRWLLPNGWTPQFPSEIMTCTCTRNLLEFTIRKRLASSSHVKFLEASQVTGLLTNSSNTAVTGVRVKEETELSAQLIVDASGRGSKAPKWLQNLGYDMPQETVVNSFLGYATRCYQSLAKEPSDYKLLYILPFAPHNPRGGGLYPIEGNRWLVTLVGVGRDYPPTDEAGFLDFARSLRSPEIYEAIKDGQSISPIYGYQRTENRLRHYEQLPRFPENFVVIGDAVCAFNPVYGQGMTVAALGAVTLDQCLKEHQHRSNQDLTGLAKRFQKRLAQVNAVPWLIATGDDFRWSTTEGGHPDFMTRMMQRYFDKVLLSATKDAYVHKVVIEVLHLVKPPTAFFQFNILTKVIFGWSKGKSEYHRAS